MSKPATHKDSHGDRIQLPMHFDVARMQQDVQMLNPGDYIYYDVMPLRAPAHLVDPSIPAPPPASDYADGSWTHWLDTPALKASEYLLSIVDEFRAHCDVTLVRLLRLAPDSIVKEHCDPTLGLQEEKSVIRLTIPIQINDDVEFFLNSSVVPMQPGQCWYMRLTDPHRVVNAGTTDRINMTIDLVPNEWLMSRLYEQQ